MNKTKTLLIVVIAAIVAIIVMLVLLFLPKGGTDSDSATVDEGVKIELSTDEKGMHQAVIGRDAFGNVENNSGGTLMEYVPADIKSMHVENNSGSFDITAHTPEGEATEYTLVGYEDFDIQSGVPDRMASAASSITFSMVAGEDKGGSEFGFDKPRATVNVEYTDGTSAVIIIGNDAPQGKGTYIKFGDGKDIFLADTDTVSIFDYSITDLIDKNITESASSTVAENAQVKVMEMKVGGESITITPYTGDKYNTHYWMTEPSERFANEGEASRIEGCVRGLLADSVVMVNPSDGQISELGLSHASMHAEYPDVTIDLRASAPDSEGKVFVMVEGKSVIYRMSADKVAWADTSLEKLKCEYVLYPKMTALKGLSVNNRDFTLSTRESHTTDDEGNESTTTITTVYEGTEEIQLADFQGFYDAVSMMELADIDEGSTGGSPDMTIRYTFDDDTSDTVELYNAGDSKYVAVVNGGTVGRARKSDVTRVLDELGKIGG